MRMAIYSRGMVESLVESSVEELVVGPEAIGNPNLCGGDYGVILENPGKSCTISSCKHGQIGFTQG